MPFLVHERWVSSATPDGWKSIGQQTQERATIALRDEPVAVRIASPRSLECAVLCEVHVVRNTVGEFAIESGDVVHIDDAIAIAVAAQRRDQSIDRRPRREEDFAVRSFRDIDQRRSLAFYDRDRFRFIDV